MRYLAQFPAGTLPLVDAALTTAFDRFRLLRSDDSAVLFETRSRISAQDVPFVKNLFAVHAESPRGPLDASVGRLAKGLRIPRASGRRERLGFRIMYHIDGQLVACKPRARQALETAISSATGARLSPRGLCQEFWVIGRRDWPMIYLAERLSAADITRKKSPKGSLSTQISSLLVAASKPQPDDVFLDPFGGSGAIVRARLRLPVRQAIYSDTRLNAHRVAVQDLADAVALLSDDALALPSVPSGSVNAIVTDPPWGEFDAEIADYSKFIAGVVSSMTRVLHPTTGRLVMLIGRRRADAASEALNRAGFRLQPPLDILVNGHPATVARTATSRTD